MAQRKRWRSIGIAAVLLLAALPARAWDDIGHQVIARIAWDNMKPETQEKAVTLLLSAPPDADLASLFPQDGHPIPVRERELFQKAATWPDIVRDEAFPERRAKYHHSTWHFTNFFWEQDENGQPRDVTRLQPLPENVAERLTLFEDRLADPARSTEERAVDLAWVLHLVGDVHQPLHASARVTATEPEGDRGGNLFKLDRDNDLHGYWDGILTRTFRRRWFEGKQERIERIARVIQQHHPKEEFAERLLPGQFEAWAREGFETSKSRIYIGVDRGREPSRAYRKAAFNAAEPAAALAGYRLAEMLDRLLGTGTD